jgi:hypothetical protein
MKLKDVTLSNLFFRKQALASAAGWPRGRPCSAVENDTFFYFELSKMYVRLSNYLFANKLFENDMIWSW